MVTVLSAGMSPVLLGHVSLFSVTCHVSPPPPLITHRHCRPGQKLQQTVKIGTFAITSATLMAKTTFSDIPTFYTKPISSFFSPHRAVNGYSEVIEKTTSCSQWVWVAVIGGGEWGWVLEAGDHVRQGADLRADPTNDGAQGDMVVYLSTPHSPASHCRNISRQVHKYFFKTKYFCRSSNAGQIVSCTHGD